MGWRRVIAATGIAQLLTIAGCGTSAKSTARQPEPRLCMTWDVEHSLLREHVGVCIEGPTMLVEYERKLADPWPTSMPGELKTHNAAQLDDAFRPSVRWSGRVDDPRWSADWVALAEAGVVTRSPGPRTPTIMIDDVHGRRIGAPPDIGEWRWRISEIDRLARVEIGLPMGEGPIQLAEVHALEETSAGGPEFEQFVLSYDPRTRLLRFDALIDLRMVCHTLLNLKTSQALRRRVRSRPRWPGMMGQAPFVGSPGIYVDPGVAIWTGIPWGDGECPTENCAGAVSERRALMAWLRALRDGCSLPDTTTP